MVRASCPAADGAWAAPARAEGVIVIRMVVPVGVVWERERPLMTISYRDGSSPTYFSPAITRGSSDRVQGSVGPS